MAQLNNIDSLYWGIAVTQVYGQSAHQVGREGLVEAVLPAELPHAEEHVSDTRRLLLASATGDRIV